MNEIKLLFTPKENKNIRVSAYCRISNDLNNEASLDEQINFYASLIAKNVNWDYAGIYYDKGISGTTITQRDQFKRMIKSALAGNIDVIITKSISRFARNTIDFIETIRALKNNNIEVYFEEENLSTFDGTSELLLTAMASMAEEQAKQVSENVKWRVKKDFSEGTYKAVLFRTFGYRNESNIIRIEESEAKVVRLIFDLYIKETPLQEILDTVISMNVKDPFSNGWTIKRIRNMLRNEKYVGDCLFGKSYVEDPLTHLKKRNHGEKNKYYIQDHHPAIIDRITWDKTLALLEKRANKLHSVYGAKKDNPKLNTYEVTAFQNFIICPYCKNNFVNRLNSYNGKKTRFFTCASNKDYKKCNESSSIPYLVFTEILKEQLNIIYSNKNEIKKEIRRQVEKLENKEFLTHQINLISKQIADLKLKINDKTDDFSISLNESIKEEIKTLIVKKINLQNQLIASSDLLSFENDYKEKLSKLEKVSGLPDINFKDYISKALPVNKNKVIFIVGNSDIPEDFDINQTLKFTGEYTYFVRKTPIKVEFGIVFNIK